MFPECTRVVREQRVEKTKKIPTDQQRMRFGDKPLTNDSASLEIEGIRHKDTIDMSVDAPPTPPQKTYVVQLSPYKSPLEAGYSPSSKQKREGIRAPTKELFKTRWHADLATENAELGRLAEAKHMQGKKDRQTGQ